MCDHWTIRFIVRNSKKREAEMKLAGYLQRKWVWWKGGTDSFSLQSETFPLSLGGSDFSRRY